MTSGRDALHQIDASIADARARLINASGAAASDARTLAEIDQREIALLHALADVRLIHLNEDGANGRTLGAVDRKAAELIAAHERTVADMAAARDAAARDLERLETARRNAEADVEAALARHQEAAAATRTRLEKDDQWLARAAEVEELGAMAARAEQKLAISRDDRAVKGAAFEADPLFQYLRRRKFATRDYRAFPLYAVLDRWVASLIRYRDHRLNYERLLEIPERFAEHLVRLKGEMETAREALEGLERDALEKDGVGGLRDAVGAARTLVETLDRQIEDAEKQRRELESHHAAAAAGKAGPLSEARTLVADALAGISIPDLKVLAAETASVEDDNLIDELIRNRRKRMEFEEARRAAVGSLDSIGRRLADLEDIRRRFKGARFDSPYSEFTGKDVLVLLVAEFLQGALSRDDLWRRIERGHRTRRRDWDNDIGGDEWRGRFGLPDHWGGGAGDWSGGPSRGSPSMPRAPRPPRMPRLPSGGGFRTGGGRGGGGFKTGGGF
ncbi:MAG: hypothetical protein A3E78_07560 [Alphaproteobacteria bacterium RIFCSPHIGHO2_12_FULL_63_12]|nr:MAG: hypothetical protein A3E78_07560 [Alphaproteobacteria bacterium RIFCSPHIGHO2_12_FULL_63_12]